MRSDVRTVTNRMMKSDVALAGTGDRFLATACRTMPLVDDFYLCQLNCPECEHAYSFGMSNLCRSPERHVFAI